MRKSMPYLALVATVILAIPICLGWVGRAFEIASLPEKQQAHETRLDSDEAKISAQTQNILNIKENVSEIRKDLNEIKRALRIPDRPTRHTTTTVPPEDLYPVIINTNNVYEN